MCSTFRVSDYLDLSGGWSRKLIIPGLPGFDKPNSGNHSLNASTTMRRMSMVSLRSALLR